jgi:hypothetical protein
MLWKINQGYILVRFGIRILFSRGDPIPLVPFPSREGEAIKKERHSLSFTLHLLLNILNSVWELYLFGVHGTAVLTTANIPLLSFWGVQRGVIPLDGGCQGGVPLGFW